MTADITFEQKLALAMSELEQTGMKPRHCKPPLHRMLWSMGVDIRPPHYASFFSNFVFIASMFSLLMGILFWLMIWSSQSVKSANVIPLVMLGGTLVGGLLAGYYRHGRNKHQLTAWDQLGLYSQQA